MLIEYPRRSDQEPNPPHLDSGEYETSRPPSHPVIEAGRSDRAPSDHRRRAPHDHVARGEIHVDPSPFFVSQSGITRKRIGPRLFQGLVHQRFVQKIRSRWSIHSMISRPVAVASWWILTRRGEKTGNK